MNKFKHPAEQGFTLIELLLVTVIIGILLAVIVPRAWRANVDAKYGLVRQNATELAAFASQWAEQQIDAQDLISTATLTEYYKTLASNTGPGEGLSYIAADAPNPNNWSDNPIAVTGRIMDGAGPSADAEATVEDTIPPERMPRNPFNGASIFAPTNQPEQMNAPIPGAIACGYAMESSGYLYFAFIFQGTDAVNYLWPNIDFYAGQDRDLAGLRNGIFMARVAQ